MNTTYFMNLMAGNIYGSKKTPAIPGEYYLGFSSTTPDASGAGVTEPSGGGYARILIEGLSEPIDGTTTNSNDINSPRTTADWGVMTHYVIYDAASGGNLLMYDKLNRPRTVETDNIITVQAGALRLSITNG